jgi:hypothetical protein
MLPGVFARILKVKFQSKYTHHLAAETKMITQTLNHSIYILNLFSLPPICPDEIIYDDEQQLAAELSTPIPQGILNQPLPEIDPDEFELLYGWFLS